MIRLFVKRPAMTIVFILIFVVMGIVSYFNLLIENTPRMDFPMVTVQTFYNGASPVEIETQIIKKVEDAVAEISQIKRIESFAYENFGYVLIEFEISADVNIKAIEVKDKLEPVTNELPRDADKPVVSKFDPTVEPIVDLILTGKDIDSLDLYEYADKKLRNKITVIEGVASLDIYGGKQRQINVKLDHQLMNKYFTSIDDIINTISARNINVPGGSLESEVHRENIRFLGEFQKIEDISNMQFVSREGKILHVSDVGTVSDSYKEIDTYTRFNGKDAVGLSVTKLSDGDAITIVKKLKKLLTNIQKDLPDGMELTIAYDSTTSIIDNTNGTMHNILIGIILTILILFLFLEDLKFTFIASIVIPTSLISTFFPMSFSGFTINFVTLLAIATSLGTLIANALVIIESVERELSKGKSPEDAAVDGTQGSFVAVMASAGTNLVVFTPIAFMGGIVGQFMKSFGLTVIYATLFSILASFTLTPMLCALLLKPKKEDHNKNIGLMKKIFLFPQTAQQWLLDEYQVLFNKIFKHPFITILAAILILIGTIFPLQHIGNEFMPSSDENVISINIKLEKGVLLDNTLNTVKDIEKLINNIPETVSFISYVGIDGTENGSITINLKPHKSRDRSDMDIINELIPEAAKIPGADISINRGRLMGGSMNSGDVSINLRGTDYDNMIKISNDMKNIMMKTGFFRSVESSYKTPADEIRFLPNDSKMLNAGVFNSQLGDIISFAVRGHDRNLFKEHGEEYEINIEMSDEYKENLNDIKNISAMTKDGLLAISELGSIVKTKGYSTIQRRDKQRVIQLNGYLSKSTAGQVQLILDDKFKEMGFPEGYGYDYVGMAEFQEESAREISKAFILAVIFAYMLLVAIMNSFKYPFVIITTIMTSFVGVFLLLFFLEFSINIGTMMALVMVVGLVVNNAILMLDYTMHRMEKGDNVHDALWKGASVKFRAILMTSLAIIFGALPQIFDIMPAKSSMGAVIVGGMLGSVFFTFFLVPIMFAFFARQPIKTLLIKIKNLFLKRKTNF